MKGKALALTFALSSPGLLVASESAAKIPQLELSGGYTYLHFSDGLFEKTLPLGWSASATLNVREWLGLVWEGNSYRSVNAPPDSPYFSEGRRLTSHTLLFGPRFSVRPHSKVSAFVDVLGGVTSPNVRGVFDWNSGDTRLALQNGAGVQVALSRKVALRVQGDVRMLPGEDLSPAFFQPRVSASIVIGLGKFHELFAPR